MLKATDADIGIIYECKLTKGKLSIMMNIAGAYGTVSYMFSQQNFEGVDQFAINLTTGEMTVRNCELLDFDTKKSYSVVVEARDNYREEITRNYELKWLTINHISKFFAVLNSGKFIRIPTS